MSYINPIRLPHPSSAESDPPQVAFRSKALLAIAVGVVTSFVTGQLHFSAWIGGIHRQRQVYIYTNEVSCPAHQLHDNDDDGDDNDDDGDDDDDDHHHRHALCHRHHRLHHHHHNHCHAYTILILIINIIV